MPTQVETGDVPMEDVSDDKPFSVDKNGVDNKVLGQSNTADKEEKKKRKLDELRRNHRSCCAHALHSPPVATNLLTN